jgi:radical SAM protein with 4Fe4S-binding SPASM domain
MKPTERCQLRCTHCFVNRRELEGSGRWDLVTFARVMRRFQRYFLDHPVPDRTLRLIWHGGEPLLMGPAFYADAIPLARRLMAEAGVRLQPSIQSNLLLVSEAWIAVIREHFGGGIGTSFDWGLRHVRGSWPAFRERWLKKYWQCREAGLGLSTITVVNRESVGIPDEVYDFFGEIGCAFETYPMAPWGESNGKAHIDEYGITPPQYGAWLSRVWDRYRDDPAPRTRPVFVHQLAAALALGQEMGNHMAGGCAAGNLVVSTDGTVSYCPALAGSRAHVYGNLFDGSLEALLGSAIRAEVMRRQLLLPARCRTCRWAQVCRGGCPADALGFLGDATREDPYCDSYRLVLHHIERDLIRGAVPVPLQRDLQRAPRALSDDVRGAPDLRERRSSPDTMCAVAEDKG